MKRHSFQVWCGAWILALRETLRNISNPDIAYLEIDKKSAALNAELVDLREWVEALQREVDDAGAKLSALQVEHGELNDELEAIGVANRHTQTRKDALQNELKRVKDECIAILILAEAGGLDRAEDTSFLALQSMTQELQDRRHKLLDDIEVQYGRANNMAADCNSKADEIYQLTAAILDESQRDKAAVTSLESEISALESDHQLFEQSLSDCKSSLESCQNSIAERSRSLQQELDAIAREEAALLIECEALDAEESLLKNELQELDLAVQESNRIESRLQAREDAGVWMEALEVVNSSIALAATVEDEVRSSRIDEALSIARRNLTHDSIKGNSDESVVPHAIRSESPSENENDEDEEIRLLSEKIRRRLGTSLTI